LLRHAAKKLFWSHEVIWFADCEYSHDRFPSHLTYFRQHRLTIPSHFLLTSEVFHTLHTDLTQDLDQLFGRLSKTCRNEVRRSSKEGIEIKQELRPDATELFLERQKWFNLRKHLGEPISRKQLADYCGHWFLYTAYRAGAWLGHLLLLHDEQRVREWVLASNLDYDDHAVVSYASRALVWNSMEDAKNKGFLTYDFGGIVDDDSDPRYGVTKFKSSFGGTLVEEQNSVVIPNRYHRLLYATLKGRG
jgi:lipid II:glycine glycyltransferase (peptidoglycan interpeptide bridge formation enzyme)